MSFTDPGATLSIKNLVEVFQLLYSAKAKWYYIGLVLGLEPHELDSIRGEDEDCLRRVLNVYLQKTETLKPTWQSLLDALRSKIVGQEHVAQEIEKYLKSKMKSTRQEESKMETVDSTRPEESKMEAVDGTRPEEFKESTAIKESTTQEREMPRAHEVRRTTDNGHGVNTAAQDAESQAQEILKSKMEIVDSTYQEESKMETVDSTRPEESKMETVDSTRPEESKMETVDSTRPEESKESTATEESATQEREIPRAHEVRRTIDNGHGLNTAAQGLKGPKEESTYQEESKESTATEQSTTHERELPRARRNSDNGNGVTTAAQGLEGPNTHRREGRQLGDRLVAICCSTRLRRCLGAVLMVVLLAFVTFQPTVDQPQEEDIAGMFEVVVLAVVVNG